MYIIIAMPAAKFIIKIYIYWYTIINAVDSGLLGHRLTGATTYWSIF